MQESVDTYFVFVLVKSRLVRKKYKCIGIIPTYLFKTEKNFNLDMQKTNGINIITSFYNGSYWFFLYKNVPTLVLVIQGYIK